MDPTQEQPESSKNGKASYGQQQLLERETAGHMQQYQQQLALQQQHLRHLQQQVQRFQQTIAEESSPAHKSKAYTVDEHEESSSLAVTESTTPDVAYDADVDDDLPAAGVAQVSAHVDSVESLMVSQKATSDRDHIYELFQPWALKTYGDQAKTKTITMRKKARILKALEGKEHSKPDSSKFRFWVKTKAFTTKRPEGFQEALSSQRLTKQLPPNAVLSDNPSEVDLFVASTSKDFGKRIYRKVAVVEEFFDIIYNVHMELGGRSGMHAGQKRTYRIITETYGFLPREAVTRFLSICPECKKNLRATSPAASSHTEEPINESSSEVEVLNYSSHTESSLEAGPSTTKIPIAKPKTTKTVLAKKRRYSNPDGSSIKASLRALQLEVSVAESPFCAIPDLPAALPKCQLSPGDAPGAAAGGGGVGGVGNEVDAVATPQPIISDNLLQLPASIPSIPKIRINPLLQRPMTPPAPTQSSAREAITITPFQQYPLCFDMNVLKSRESLMRYYEFMRRFYGGGLLPASPQAASTPQLPVLTPPLYGADILQSLRFPQTGLAKTQDSEITSPTDSQDSRKPLSKFRAASNEDQLEITPPAVKKQKTSPDSSKSFMALPLAIANIPSDPQQQQKPTTTPTHSQSSAINLSKQLLFRSKGASPPTPTPTQIQTPTQTTTPTPQLSATSTPSTQYTAQQPTPSTSRAIKFEPTIVPKSSSQTPIRIPQIFPTSGTGGTSGSSALMATSARSSLPPLDLERLKPITSTYLQLTRSMGLTDEDALRFDNLVSKDFSFFKK